MNMIYGIDLSLKPTTFDLWHVCLAGTVVVLSFMLIMLLLVMLISAMRCKKKSVQQVSQPVAPVTPPEPVIKIVEKIVEVEKLVHAPVPEPVILKESTPEAALQLLGLLQKEARFIDFIKEDITSYADSDVCISARVVHE